MSPATVKMKVKDWVMLMRNSKVPPDRGRMNKSKTTTLLREVPEFNAANMMRNKIKQTFQNNIKISQDICELKFRIFILNKIISDQLEYQDLKMSASANSTFDEGIVKDESGVNNSSRTPGKREWPKKYCEVDGCDFTCKQGKKMVNHMKEVHGVNVINNDTVDTDIFGDGIDSPSKHSTQTPATNTPMAGTSNKRQRSPKATDDPEPEPSKPRLEETTFSNSQMSEAELSSAAEDVESKHSETAQLM